MNEQNKPKKLSYRRRKAIRRKKNTTNVTIWSTKTIWNRKHNITLNPFPDYIARMMKKYNFIKFISHNTQALRIILRMEENFLYKKDKIYYYNPINEKLQTIVKIKTDYNNTEWNCPICNEKIFLNIYCTAKKHFCCDKCQDERLMQLNYKKILFTMNDYYEFLKKRELIEQTEYLTFIKNNR